MYSFVCKPAACLSQEGEGPAECDRPGPTAASASCCLKRGGMPKRLPAPPCCRRFTSRPGAGGAALALMTVGLGAGLPPTGEAAAIRGGPCTGVPLRSLGPRRPRSGGCGGHSTVVVYPKPCGVVDRLAARVTLRGTCARRAEGEFAPDAPGGGGEWPAARPADVLPGGAVGGVDPGVLDTGMPAACPSGGVLFLIPPPGSGDVPLLVLRFLMRPPGSGDWETPPLLG
mmetsp:Transcript_89559/g.158054  ORF Transcript_89559/g.158054 Transcript_89559/m.158054 type:complete len:228 (+) Transcript_89559:52-735(+)